MRTLTLALSLALVPAAVAADAPPFDPARMSANVRTISADDFEGRAPATEGEKKTLDWLVKEMQAAGLKPAGDEKDGARTWLQAVPLQQADIAGTPTISLTEGEETRALTQGEEIAIRAPMDGSREVDVKNAPLVFVGYGVDAPERNWDDFKGIDLKGKIAIALINDPDYETGEGDFGGKEMTYYGRWTYKFEEAARRGALGLLIVHETEPASYGWATVKNSNTNTMFDIVRKDPGAVHPKLEGWIQRDLAVSLFRNAGLDFEAQKKSAQTREFKPVELKGAALSTAFKVESSVITSYNVAGQVVGKDRPDETVLYTAHWDHLGVGAPDASGDRIYNGAIDNATGIAALVEMARAFAAGPQPERTVVFLAVTAEERGLLGSEYYAANPLFPLSRTAGVLNMDALDPGGEARNFTTSGSVGSQLLDMLVAEGKARGLTYTPDPHPEAGYFFRSDHFPFAKRGVPALSFGSGNDLIEGGIAAGEAERADYTKNRYHQPADEWREDWTFAGMARDLTLLEAVGRKLANSGDWPRWAPGSEFQTERNKTIEARGGLPAPRPVEPKTEKE